MTHRFDARRVVTEALAKARESGCTGYHLRSKAAKLCGVESLDLSRPGDRLKLDELEDAFRAVVWPETE